MIIVGEMCQVKKQKLLSAFSNVLNSISDLISDLLFDSLLYLFLFHIVAKFDILSSFYFVF